LFREHAKVRKSGAAPREDAHLGSSPRLVPDIIDPLLALEVRHNGGGVVVRVTGDLNASTVFEFRDLLAHIMSEGAPRELVVDLLELRSVDSTGVAVFQLAHERARAGGSRFVLANPSPSVSEFLGFSGLAEFLDIVALPPPAPHDAPLRGSGAGHRAVWDPTTGVATS
jgi:anti-anti-sigma factor